LASTAVDQIAEAANAIPRFRLQQKAAQQLIGIQGHALSLVRVGVNLSSQLDLLAIEADQLASAIAGRCLGLEA
jgi:hypothetical protein